MEIQRIAAEAKIEACIKSCETKDHLEGVYKMLTTFYDAYIKNICIVKFDIVDDYIMYIHLNRYSKELELDDIPKHNSMIDLHDIYLSQSSFLSNKKLIDDFKLNFK